MKFLDTSFLIDIIRRYLPAKNVLDQLDQDGPHTTNTIVVHEFLVGAFGATNSTKELAVRKTLLRKLIILPFDLASAENSAQIEDKLRKQGQPIGGADMLIAGSMIAKNITTIVTRNAKHFQKIDEIIVESY